MMFNLLLIQDTSGHQVCRSFSLYLAVLHDISRVSYYVSSETIYLEIVLGPAG